MFHYWLPRHQLIIGGQEVFKMKKTLKTFVMVSLFVLFSQCINSGHASCVGLDFLLRRARSACIVAYIINDCSGNGESNGFDEFLNLRKVSRSNTLGIVVGYIGIAEKWPDGTPISNGQIQAGDVVLFKVIKKDRSQVIPEPQPKHLTPIVYRKRDKEKPLIDFVNNGCNTYFTANGSLSAKGRHREDILQERFYVHNISNTKFRDLLSPKCSTEDDFCHAIHDFKMGRAKPTLPECEKLSVLPSNDDFLHNYLKKSKPVIFKNMLRDWPAFTKWSNTYLRKQFGEKNILYYLSPHGDYEGVEPASLWEGLEDEDMPKSHRDQLQFPDLVLVRPASMNSSFTSFLDVVEGLSNGSIANLSAYLQYTSIPAFLPGLEKDLRVETLFPGILKEDQLNIWLSDGGTRGKLHFDQFENFLCQISGKKQVTLFDPNNNHQLYEGHIMEAKLAFNWTTGAFSRRHIRDFSNVVMSPVDIVRPDYTRFPLFGETYPLNCTLEEGDVLYMPSFWWHEVQSYPNVTEGRNLAVNFWYEPFFTKEIPCPECPMDVNPEYRHLL